MVKTKESDFEEAIVDPLVELGDCIEGKKSFYNETATDLSEKENSRCVFLTIKNFKFSRLFAGIVAIVVMVETS